MSQGCSVGEHVMSVHTNLGNVVQLSDSESHVAHDTILQEGGNLLLNTTVVLIPG